MSDKNGIRAEMRILRKNFSGEARISADNFIAVNFLKRYGGCESFFIYNSFSTEARTDVIIQSLLKNGKRVYLPRVEGKDMVPVPYGGGFVKGAFGIYEPEGSPFGGEIEVTLIPLLCVNPRGFRIGYGGGFYDRYLADKNTEKVGMGYGFQRKAFEEEPFDVRLDSFIFEGGINYF